MMQIDLSQFFTQLDVACLFLAALGHDVGHPGTNNAYAIRTKNPLALLYNDKSVLENHHISLFF